MKKNKNKNISLNKTNGSSVQGTAVEIQNRQARVLVEGQIVTCQLPGALLTGRNSIVAGDHVEMNVPENGQHKMTAVLPRKTALFRGNRRTERDEVLIAANADLVLAVVTADYLLHQAGFPEAALIAAGRAGIGLGIFVSKWDLAGEKAKSVLEDKLEIYRQSAEFVLAGSALERQEELAERLKGRSTVFVGDRASGKTTLMRGILGLLNGEAYTGSIASTHAAKYRHCADGTGVIDTPGFRDFALRDITEEERNGAFPEIGRAAAECRFGSCTHTHEEGCGVLNGIRQKGIARERYDTFLKMGGGTPGTDSGRDYRREACTESFTCKVCGNLVLPEGAGSQHRNHCPKCLSSVHVDDEPGDRAALCGGVMEAVSVWVRGGGEWAIIHRCKECGELSSNRIAADDNPALLLSIAVKPLAMTPFPLNKIEEIMKG
ncbi:MAG: RNHCP domain-containing protein [Oscillospiraceae bacterium]